MLPRNSLKPVLQAGLLAGTLDGLAAAIIYLIRTGKDPLNVYRFIASGVFGAKAFTGGVSMALWGIFFHYCIATGWTIVFFIAYPRISLLRKSIFATSIFYGIFVWVLMNLVVIPLSHVPVRGPMDISSVITGIVILIVCIGLPITWMASKFYRSTSRIVI